jgi:DNA-binding transcriptional LysR family regulator
MRDLSRSLCENTNTQMALDWDDFRYFLAVARTGRLTTAARRLNVDHATCSRRIAALEGALAAKLFERRPQGYFLTNYGERLIAMAEAIESQILAAQSDVGGQDLALSGTVRIGAPDGFTTYFLAPRIGQLTTKYPSSISSSSQARACSPCRSARRISRSRSTGRSKAR